MKLKNYIKLIRPLNLLIIAATMLLTRYFIILPFFRLNQLELVQSLPVFLLLLFSVICIAIFGYILNDVEDIKSDEHNEKQRPLVVFPDQKDWIENLAFIFLLIGLFTGLIAWLMVGSWMLIMIHLFAAASLYFYTKYLQKTALLGNFCAAFLCAVLPIIVFIFDMPSMIEAYFIDHPLYFLENGDKTYSDKFFKIVLKNVLAFSSFILLLTLQREIVKDLEDQKGDGRVGMRTLPIRFGTGVAIKLSVVFGVLLLILFAWYLVYQINWLFSFNHFLIFASVAFFFFCLPLFQAMYSTTKNKYALASKMLKISMLGGLLFWIAFGIIY